LLKHDKINIGFLSTDL